MEGEKERKAAANPTKEFFVNMITRDITLEDSIFDLIDNSIDAAWKAIGSPAMSLMDDTDLSDYLISIELSPKKFSIKDNCGGMSLDDAVNHAFSFGRRESEENDDYSIGVYGIGMKRAVFKIGKEIRIRSTVLEGEESTLAFAVPINVNDWLKSNEPPWDFDIVDDENLDKHGVEIVVEDLTLAARIAFNNPEFIANLRRMIARDYMLYLNRGLNLTVCGQAITGIPINLAQSDDFVPLRYNYEDQQNGEVVSVEIIGGMASAPPDDAEPDEKYDGDKRFGWYVACNGRIVLSADKSTISGWGTPDWPQWHSQYSGFIGLVLFSAPNTAALPLTTTKRSVDLTSEIFNRAKTRMRDLSKEWISYTNTRKYALDEAKRKEDQTTSVSIQSVENSQIIMLPKLEPKKVDQPANVHYSVPKTKLRKLAQEFGDINMTYRDVGLNSFEYAYDDLVEDE